MDKRTNYVIGQIFSEHKKGSPTKGPTDPLSHIRDAHWYGNIKEKIRRLFEIGTEKITLSLKPFTHTDGLMDRQIFGTIE